MGISGLAFSCRIIGDFVKDNFLTVKDIFCEYSGDAEKVIIPDGITMIRSSCFSGNENLKEISLPVGLEYIDSNAFSGCNNLKKIDKMMEKKWILK